MVEQDTREIESITFSLFSAEQILNMSVCKVDNSKLGIDKSVKTKETGVIARLKTPDSRSGSSGTVYDPRMGTLENGVNCETCHQDVWKCPGHFGHIEFTEPIIHPLYYKQVTSFLKCFCIKCFQLLITRDIIYLNGLNRYKGSKRFEMILEKLDKVDICSHCSHPQPEIKFSSTDSTISMVYKQKTKDKIIIVLGVEEIRKIFDNISDEDVRIVGFDPALVHPRNFIMTMFLVLPPCCRPYVITDGNMCDDDLTNQLVEIIKANNHLKSEDDVPLPDAKRQKYLHSLKFRVLTFFNNCVSPDTPIPMWNGCIKRADEVLVGDLIIGDDGKHRTVLSICYGEDEMYEVSQNKGDTYIVNGNHILSLKFSSDKQIFWVKANRLCPLGSWWMKWYDPSLKRIRSKIISVTDSVTKEQAYNIIKIFTDSLKTPDVIDIPIREYIELSDVTKRCLMGFKLNTPVEWEHKSVALDPYILGMWLGDGDSTGKGFTSADPELVDVWREWCQHNDAEVVLHPNKDRKDIYFGIKNVNNIGTNRINSAPLKKILDIYGLVNNKHIPKDYIINSKDIRLQLLAGLIDTDGYVSPTGTEVTISQCEKRLHILEDALLIGRSLGLQSIIKKKNCSYTYQGVKKSSICYILYLSGSFLSEIPTRLQRKKCKAPLKRNVLSSNITVKSIGIGKYNGFTIDGNHRFILGDFTVTHNSQGKAKHTTNGRPIKGLKERLGGKTGQIRNNLMGKRATCPETPILMFGNGTWKRAEHIVIGDIVVGDDGLPRTVVDTVTGTSPLYTVKQSYGDNYNVSCEHILTLKYSDQCQIYWRPEQSKYGGWSMKWYDRNFKIVKQKKIAIIPPISKDQAEINMINFLEEKGLTGKKYNWCSNRKTAGTWRVNYTESGIRKSKEFPVVIGMTKSQAFEELEKLRDTLNQDPVIDIHIEDYRVLLPTVRSRMLGIKLSVPIQWEKRYVKMDPRMLGLWLGDGCSSEARITNPDQPIIDYVRQWTQEQGGDLHTRIGDNLQHGISRCGFLDLLRELNLYNNKHIPEDYIVNDEETRLLVLAGLIDTDGSVENEGRTIRITQCFEHKIILDGALRIARSLGFRASMNERNTSWVGSDGLITTGRAYELTISGEGIEKIPTLLPRKRCVSPLSKDMSCYNIEVVEAGIGRFCGFEVDQNNRFLLGDFTVTHNCDQSARTVIGPDPTLKMGQLGMPREMAEILTLPVQVANYNIDMMNDLVNSGKANFVLTNGGETRINLQSALYYRGTRLLHGDIIVNKNGEESVVNNGRQQLQLGERVKRNGEFLEKIKYPCKKEYVLKIGDIVERQLQDGDIVLLNRQPTLHKGSMMAQEVVVMPYKTLRFNLAIAKSFNADFDKTTLISIL